MPQPSATGSEFEGVRARRFHRRDYLWIDRQTLLYDIGNYAYIEGHKLESAGVSAEAVHLLADITAEGNIDRVDRVLEMAWDTVASILDTSSPVLRVRVKPLVHEYLVCMAVADWLDIVHAPAAQTWHDKADAALSGIRSAVLGVKGSHRRPTGPW